MPVPAERMTDMPEWFDGKKINEVLFCQSFLETHPMKCIQGSFFTVDGLVDGEESLKMEIYDRIKDYICCGILKNSRVSIKSSVVTAAAKTTWITSMWMPWAAWSSPILSPSTLRRFSERTI